MRCWLLSFTDVTNYLLYRAITVETGQRSRRHASVENHRGLVLINTSMNSARIPFSISSIWTITVGMPQAL